MLFPQRLHSLRRPLRMPSKVGNLPLLRFMLLILLHRILCTLLSSLDGLCIRWVAVDSMIRASINPFTLEALQVEHSIDDAEHGQHLALFQFLMLNLLHYRLVCAAYTEHDDLSIPRLRGLYNRSGLISTLFS